MKHFIFSQIDSWFFRESRSMDGAGSTALASVFPPPSKTLLGAIRRQIGDKYHQENGTSWQTFEDNQELQSIIGYGNDYAGIKAQGAWLYQSAQKELYFPCPMNLQQQGEDKTIFFTLSTKPVHCDLGKVRLPQLIRDKDPKQSQVPIEEVYLSMTAFADVLNAQAPSINSLITENSIFTKDPRLGIERNNQKRKTEDGKLYQTNHIRLAKNWQIYLGLSGIDEQYLPNDKILRLGGEARMTALTQLLLDDAPSLPKKPTLKADTRQLVIYLATPLPDFERDNNTPILPNKSFIRNDNEQFTSWIGDIKGKDGELIKDIKVISAMIGKPTRVGGWDMANHKSLPVRSFIPAGSCWYIETNNAQALINALHGQFLTEGNDRALGYGQIFVGIAPEQSKTPN